MVDRDSFLDVGIRIRAIKLARASTYKNSGAN